MSVIVKGMKMPEIESGHGVKAEIRNTDGKLELGIMTGGYYCCKQWSYYPIVEVPTPHGRLIEEPRYFKYNGLVYISPFDFVGIAKYFLDQCKDIPTIIEAEEKT